MTDREAMQQALEALGWTDEWRPCGLKEQAIAALRERLAQPEYKPATKAGELRAMKDEFWKQPEQKPIKESSATHSHLWIGDLYGKEKNT